MKSNSKMFGLCLILILATLGFTLYQFFMLRTSMIETNQTFKHLDNTMSIRVANLQMKVDNLAQNNLQLMRRMDPGQWMIEQTKFYVSMAAARLTYARDVKAAIALLSEAEDFLKPFNNPKFNLLKEAISKDKADLMTTKVPDVDNLRQKVDTLIQSLNNLPSRGFNKNLTNEMIKPEETTQTKTNIQQGLKKSWSEFKNLIKIRHHDKPIAPIMEAEQQVLAKEHLSLMLHEVRFALLQGDDLAYKQSIKDATDWLNQYFESSNEAVKQFENTLKELSDINIHPKLPDLNRSLQSFDTLRQP